VKGTQQAKGSERRARESGCRERARWKPDEEADEEEEEEEEEEEDKVENAAERSQSLSATKAVRRRGGG
jgi:hypothetical protein